VAWCLLCKRVDLNERLDDGRYSMGAIDLSVIGELSGLLAWGAALLYGGALVLIGCVLHRIQ
jgi:hypothetical protein